MDPVSPTHIGKYEVLKVIGRGGMGVVYRAQDKRMGRQVAIKTLTEAFIKDAGMLERFYREAERTGMLKHPNIVTVYDLGEQDGLPYIVMEFVEGEPLDRIIRERQHLPLIYKLKVIEQVCHALSYAHHRGVIHRDVKAANVILQQDGVVKLLDFGIARLESGQDTSGLTLAGNIIGTLPYMAPERLQGAEADERSDVFATGVLMYQLLTGDLPFQGEELVLAKKILSGEYPALASRMQHCPETLEHIIRRALAGDSQARYASADEMAADLYTATEALKQDQVHEMIREASRLSADENYVEARDVLVRLLKIDTQQSDARRLLAEVQQRLSHRQRLETAGRLIGEAEDALSEKDYDRAIASLEKACRLCPEDRSLAERLESAKKRKQSSELIDGYLRQADAARRAGDYKSAQTIVERALELDRDNSRLRAAYHALARQAEQAAQQKEAKRLLELARTEVQSRRFQPALEILREAEKLDASAPEFQALFDAAQLGLRQQERRQLLERIEEQIASAHTRDEITAALQLVNEGLAQMPAEARLLRIKAQLDLHLRDETSRQRVDEIVQQCRVRMETAPAEALQLAQSGLEQMPGNERLQALHAAIEQRLATHNAEQACAGYLQRANQALNRADYTEAVAILESCPSDVLSPEIRDVLELARGEMHRAQREAQVANALAQGQKLLHEGRYGAVVQLLEPLLESGQETSVRQLIEYARRLGQSKQQPSQQSAYQPEYKEEPQAGTETLRRAEALLAAEFYEEAVALLETEAASTPSTELRARLDQARAARDQEAALLARAGKSYAALMDESLSADWLETRSALAAASPHSVLGTLGGLLDSRVMSRANHIASAHIKAIRAEIRARQFADADKLLSECAVSIQYASAEHKAEWSRLSDQVHRETGTSRLRRTLRDTFNG